MINIIIEHEVYQHYLHQIVSTLHKDSMKKE